MADSLKTGASALLAFQRAIATTSHNIANSATEGYTRQRVDLQANPSVQRPFGNIGQGVNVNDIERLGNTFAEKQILQTGSELSRLNTLHSYASQIDDMMATSSLTLTPSINSFFASLADANNNPTNSTSRMSVINSAEHLTGNFRSLYAGLDSAREQMTGDLSATVNDINEVTQQITDLNKVIMERSGNSSDNAPGDLLDQRNNLIGKLSEQLDINTIDTGNGGMDIYIANGQSLITAGVSRQLQLLDNPANTNSLPIALTDGVNTQMIGDQLSGGKIGGLIDFNRNVLSPANNDLGRMAVSLAAAMNEQHALGIDTNGALGQAFFNMPEVAVESSSDNAGTATVAATFSDPSKLTTSAYEVGFDGVNYSLTRLSDNSTVSGGPVMSMDGISVEVSGSMAAGDTFDVLPTRYAARDLSVALTSGEQLALGSPIRVETALANTGNAQASVSSIQDPSDPAFNSPVDLVFNDPPDTFNLIDRNSGSVLTNNVPYEPEVDITLNGWTIKIVGIPYSSDTFSVEQNQGAIASNQNGLAMADIQSKAVIDGVGSLSDAYGTLIGNVGTRTRQAELNSGAMQSMHNSSMERRENISGVNLDEEAINLTRYQQAYQAAAQVINTADEMFQTLLGAIR